jgi:hypothetical protein
VVGTPSVRIEIDIEAQTILRVVVLILPTSAMKRFKRIRIE